jgi:hypothetical protein
LNRQDAKVAKQTNENDEVSIWIPNTVASIQLFLGELGVLAVQIVPIRFGLFMPSRHGMHADTALAGFSGPR